MDTNKNDIRDGVSGSNNGNFKTSSQTSARDVISYYPSYAAAKRNVRPLLTMAAKDSQKLHNHVPLDVELVDLLLEEYENEDDRSKRYDDYGHMRFGKRGGEDQFDDYGHMRFGRSV